MVDIDHFKAFNDLYGHQAGDQLLKEVARLLDKGRREVDRVYRYGGEEFAVLLPETAGPEAAKVAERMRALIGSLEIRIDGRAEHPEITISLGIASFPDDREGFSSLVEAADVALYSAKRAAATAS